MAHPTPLHDLKVSKHFIPAHPPFPKPNHPLLIYHACFPHSTANQVEHHLTRTGVVRPEWRYTMYKQHHFHSTTHEVLVVVAGSAEVTFGGPDNPGGVTVVVERGDVIVVPAGLAHARVGEGRQGQTCEDSFMMVGSYPGNAAWDHCTGGEDVSERINRLGWFDLDPVYGREGPVFDA